jgi:hypothetical protein
MKQNAQVSFPASKREWQLLSEEHPTINGPGQGATLRRKLAIQTGDQSTKK